MKKPWFFIKNVRKPSGFWGRLLVANMNHGHAALTLWALDLLNIKHAANVIDIGCGGGRAIEILLNAGCAEKIYGIDYAQTSVDMAKKRNAKAVSEGKVEIYHFAVSRIPFEDDFMDYAVSIESYYFWPDLVQDMKEVYRIIKPYGKFMIVAKMYKNELNTDSQLQVVKDLNMRNLTLHEFREAFKLSGFSNIKIICHDLKGWIAVIGEKK